MRTAGFIASILLCLSGSTVAAQTSPSPVPPQDEPPTTTVEDVVVIGGALDKLAEEFVNSVAAPARQRGLARWEGEVCLGVVNFRSAVAHQLSDHISEVARGLAIELGRPGCEPNIVIVGTRDGRALASELVDRRRSAFRYGYTRSNRGSAALARFRTTENPVRWWHISLLYRTDTGEIAIRLPGQGPIQWPCPMYRGPRYCDLVTDRIVRAVVIVDVDNLPDVTFKQLADYLSVVALSQVDPETDFSRFDTVLNVMSRPDGVAGLTDWDINYLRALYADQPQRLDPDEQAASLAELMRKSTVE